MVAIPDWVFGDIVTTQEFIVTAIVFIIATALFTLSTIVHKSIAKLDFMGFTFIIFTLSFILHFYSPFVAASLANIYALAIGILIVRGGVHQNSLGRLNYGLLIITSLVICRFFDANISFIVRGLLFIAVGVSFFAVNYYWLKKRGKTNE